MAIDITTEKVVTPAKATEFCPPRRRGAKANCSTIFRWMVHGVKPKGRQEPIKLESICVGNTRCTSVEGLQRFFDALTAAADAEHSSAVTPPPPTKSRLKEIAAAERRLARART